MVGSLKYSHKSLLNNSNSPFSPFQFANGHCSSVLSCRALKTYIIQARLNADTSVQFAHSGGFLITLPQNLFYFASSLIKRVESNGRNCERPHFWICVFERGLMKPNLHGHPEAPKVAFNPLTYGTIRNHHSVSMENASAKVTFRWNHKARWNFI